MASDITLRQRRLSLYPDPIRAPNVPLRPEKKSNPRIYGWLLVISAFLMEWVGFIRMSAWRNAGFNSLRDIYDYLALTEPRYDATVFPLGDEDDHDDDSLRGEDTSVVLEINKSEASCAVDELRSRYLSGELTPLDVVRAILPLIRRDTTPQGEHCLAWFEVRADLAIQAAEASTQRYKEGRPLGLLDGIPTGIKDEFDMQGYKTTLGSRNDYVSLYKTRPVQDLKGDGNMDSWCVRKLQEAGVIILGKLSMHEFGMDTPGYNITYGTPRNPYNPGYYCGGSSSGSAYAVAAGLVPFTLGSDGGGSIRIPTGKKSFNLLQDNPTRPKLLGIPEAWIKRSTPAVQRLCHEMVDWLVEHKGYKTVPIDIPLVSYGQIAHALTLLTDAAALLPDPKGISPANKILLALGRTTPASDYQLAQKLRRVLMQHLAWLWSQHPGMLIVTPTTACAGWPIRRGEAELRFGISDGDQTMQSMEYVWMANLCGVPSISVPAGFVVPEGPSADQGEVAPADTVGKVPVGVMAMADWCDEEALLRFGFDTEDAARKMGKLERPGVWVDVVEMAKGFENGNSKSGETIPELVEEIGSVIE
ncbi:hypothetical protein E8E14_005020 [Neopestalotiopsis sp. 37M]|nr:hypothetical protein E8E14_005020 [Neopestalotiopsis sp. 37M]